MLLQRNSFKDIHIMIDVGLRSYILGWHINANLLNYARMWWRQGPDHECFPLCTCVSKAALVPLNNEAPYNSSQHCLQVQSCQTHRLPTWPPAGLTSCSSRPCRLYFVPQDSHSRAVHVFQRSGPLSLPFFRVPVKLVVLAAGKYVAYTKYFADSAKCLK